MNTDFIIEKNVRDNPKLRQSFNRLALQTWGFDFEDWYQNGYWGTRYIPYAMVCQGQVVANVSVNLMTFAGPDGIHRYIQLGTVMTSPEYRLRGLSRRLMEEIDRDYEGKAEGFYLFANDSVLDFYPRFGYRAVKETGYSMALPAGTAEAGGGAAHNNAGNRSMQEPFSTGIGSAQTRASSRIGSFALQRPCARRVSVKTPGERMALEQAIARSAVCGRFDMRENPGLILFYVTKFMQENVYVIPSLDAYVIAEAEDDTLLLHGIFAPSPVDPALAAAAFGRGFRRLQLGFTPADPSGYTGSAVQEEDTTLFIRGAWLEGFEGEAKRFPTLSHA